MTTNLPNKIPKTDHRYALLESIPMKDFENDHSYLYLRINDEKDYFIVSIDATIQTQILWYSPNDDDNTVVRIWAHRHFIPTTNHQEIEMPPQPRQRPRYDSESEPDSESESESSVHDDDYYNDY